MAGLAQIHGIPKKLHVNYKFLKPHDRIRAQEFFISQTSEHPRSSWMERRFLETLGSVAQGNMTSKIPAKAIEVVDPKDPNYFANYNDFSRHEEDLRNIGKQALSDGELMAIDLCAGMATGFGGNIAKASVRVQMDARGAETKGVTYLDIKRSNYLKLQKEHKRHFIAAAMVSDATAKDVRENLQAFADSHNMELVLIEEGMPRDEIKRIWRIYKDRWDTAIIAPIIRQPSTLHISKDGKNVDGEYMKGHGDFYDVVKHQLKDVMEVLGIKYVFSSNIDNTGALVSRTILGYFIEQMQQETIEAMMEAAEKYEGDKGGVPAKVHGKFTVLEGAYVPDEWKDRFNGREVFPVFNTNTFWFKASALLNNEFNLPLMTSKIIDDKWLKIESIMGHGLESLKWKALVVDRGLRFLPAKYLTDVWVGRTDWIKWFHNRLMPIMRDGKYVQKPLLEVSEKILGGVEDLNKRIFGFGAYDSMKYLNTLIIGGEGKHFNEVGDYITKCAVNYSGNVAIIFEYKENRPSGTLIIQGSSESDEISLKDSIIFVPAGATIVINKSKSNEIDPAIKAEDLNGFMANAVTWTEDKRRQVIDNFFPSAERVVSLQDYINKGCSINLSGTAKENINALMKVFKVTGSYTYEVCQVQDEKVTLKVVEDSKAGIAVRHKSRADEQEVIASPRKALAVKEGNRLHIETEGDITFVGIPEVKDGKVVALHMLMGKYDEGYPDPQKAVLLKGKLDQTIAYLEKSGIRDKEIITALFCKIEWQFLLEFAFNDVATKIHKSYNAMISSGGK